MAPECEDDKEYKAIPNQMGTHPDDSCCDTNTVRRIPDELREPKDQVPSEELSHYPGPIVIGNLPVVVECEEPGSMGDTVTHGANERTRNLYFSSFLEITEDVLTYIAVHKLENTIASLIADQLLDAETLRSMTGMRITEAQEFVTRAYEIQQELTNAVLEIAKSELECYWLNTPQEADCPDPEMAQPDQYPEAVVHAEIPAGKFKSFISQEDADRQALEAAKAMLNCFYVNKPFTALCEERPDRPMDVMEHVPNDTAPIYPGRNLRVGTVEVPAGMFTSRTSQEEADRKAMDWGYAQLVCWYPNLIVHADCDDPRARNIGVDPDQEAARDADIYAKTPGQHVTVPYGYYTSDLSTEDATMQAEMFAQSLLQCCYINRPLSLECTSEDVILSTGEKVIFPPAPYPTSPVPFVHVPAGSFTSCVSQEEADAFAAMSVEGTLDCRYCNLPVMPTCVPDWVVDGASRPSGDPDHIDLPLWDGHIENAHHPNTPASTFPLNATRGIQADAVCDSSAQLAQQIADQLAKLPIVSDPTDKAEVCTYYNDEVIIACQAADPYNPDYAETKYNPAEGYWAVNPKTGRPYYFYSMYPVYSVGSPGDGTHPMKSSICLYAPLTSPTPGSYIIVSAGMFSGNGADSKDSLNGQAIGWGMSLISCWVANPETQAFCIAYESAVSVTPDLNEPGILDWDSLCDDLWTLRVKSPQTEAEVPGTEGHLAEWANGSSNPIVITAGKVALKGYISPEQALSIIKQQLYVMATSQVICAWGNNGMTSTVCSNDNVYTGSLGGLNGCICVQHESVNKIYQAVTIGPDTFFSDTQAEANYTAYTVAVNAAFCYTDDWLIYYDCSQALPYSPSPPPPSPSPSPIPPPPPPPPPSSDCDIFFEIEWYEVLPGFYIPVLIPESIVNGDGLELWLGLDWMIVAIEGLDDITSVIEPCHEISITIGVKNLLIATDPWLLYVNCVATLTFKTPCPGYYASSPAYHGGNSGCFYECPNYKACITKEELESIALRQESITTKAKQQTNFLNWENDVAANYEIMSAELTQLQNQLNDLMKQL